MNKTKGDARNKKLVNAATVRVRGAVPYRPKMSKADTISAVDTHLAGRTKLADYRSTVIPLTSKERELLIDQALDILDKVYAHLPLKRALHANDPIQSLRLLRLRQAGLDERAFHSALMDVFLGLRDLHTNYILPTGYAQKFAFLPFRVEEYYEQGGVAPNPDTTARIRNYIVSWVSPVNTVSSLKEGMIVTHWNGSPIDLAVARNGNREAGSNSDARRAQGIEALTLRWLGMSLPPDEDWVNLTYTNGTKTYESRFDWEVIDAFDRVALLAGLNDAVGASLALGLDLNRVLLDRVRKLVFDPQAVFVEEEATTHLEGSAAAAPVPAPARSAVSVFPEVFPRFGEVKTPSGTVAYIRLKSFAPNSEDSNVVDRVVAEMGRILATLPQTGLILDVRGNGGGYINIGERILQMLTPWEITPEPFHFLATPLTLTMATPENGLDAWNETIVQGLESGASFSQGFPLTDPKACNELGQMYQGPVVLVTDALCYSTTDIFSAGFQDHQIGTILGCHASTGAGGANVWDAGFLQRLAIKPTNPFVPLPQGAGMRVAARRCTRVGNRSGSPVEDYGVVPDVRYYITKTDVVGNNEDLIAACAKILAGLPKQTLRLSPAAASPLRQFTAQCSNIDRLDVFLNDRPVASQNVMADSLTVDLPTPAPRGSNLRANGYRTGELVVSTRLQI
ncbi:MAG TPA: S41 family peptidase [Chthoniobacterales bacterium]|nr:S41 family peptidase [Chthoniobacterales bacterium]